MKNRNSFFRTLSYREFLTAFAVAFFVFVLIELMNYYSNEPLFEYTYKKWVFTFTILAYLDPDNLSIYVGYMLKEDSSKSCYQIYSQLIDFDNIKLPFDTLK